MVSSRLALLLLLLLWSICPAASQMAPIISSPGPPPPLVPQARKDFLPISSLEKVNALAAVTERYNGKIQIDLGTHMSNLIQRAGTAQTLAKRDARDEICLAYATQTNNVALFHALAQRLSIPPRSGNLPACAADGTCDWRGRTALMYAARLGQIEVMRKLIRVGSNGTKTEVFPDHGRPYLDARDCDGYTALMHACEAGQVTAVNFLLNSGAKTYYRTEDSNFSAIQLAENSGNQIVIDILRAHDPERMKDFFWRLIDNDDLLSNVVPGSFCFLVAGIILVLKYPYWKRAKMYHSRKFIP